MNGCFGGKSHGGGPSGLPFKRFLVAETEVGSVNGGEAGQSTGSDQPSARVSQGLPHNRRPNVKCHVGPPDHPPVKRAPGRPSRSHILPPTHTFTNTHPPPLETFH